MVVYKKGDLFDHIDSEEIVIVHSCNAQGVWGSGFALQLSKIFPCALKSYEKCCLNYKKCKVDITGKALLVKDFFKKNLIVCLITSEYYGKYKSEQEIILEKTKLALEDFLTKLPLKNEIVIHSPKINSGLFGVSWDLTEPIINDFLDKCKQNNKNITWIVWEK